MMLDPDSCANVGKAEGHSGTVRFIYTTEQIG